MAQSEVDLIPAEKKDITGNQTQPNFATAASLLYGMPFELSFDVALTNTTVDYGPSYNNYGSSILTTGTNPFNTPTNGIQVYLHAKGNNNGQLLITANGQRFFFSNVTYNTDKFNVHMIQSNGQLTMEVTNYATTTGKSATKVLRYTKPMMFNQIDNLCYAMPTGMNISNMSLTVRTEDIKNYVNNILAKGVGYLTDEAREYICENLDGSNKLDVYKQFIAATTLDGSGNFAPINGKRSYQMPEIGKVYTIRGVCQDHTYYLMREDNAQRDADVFSLTATAPDMSDKVEIFKYLWSPREKSTTDDSKMAFYHATGTGQYLTKDGLSLAGTSLANAQEWTLSNGTEAGRMAIYGHFSNGDRYMAMNYQGNKIGDWPSAGGVYSRRQNDKNWSTDIIFEEVPFLSAYELIVTGPAGFNVNDITVHYSQKKEGTDEHYSSGEEIVGADITAGGLVFINKEYEESTSKWRLSISDFTPVERTGYVSVVTLGSGVVYVEYTQFAALKEKAETEINAAQSRLTNFAQGALYTQEAITTAKDGIAAAQSLFDNSHPKEACEKLEQTMETFYMTIDGRYVIMENGTSTNEKFLSTTGTTNLCAQNKATNATGNYFGVYQLHYISGGAYQLRNAYHDNYVGQTTSAGTVNSASNTVASRWRGTYTFDLKKTDNSEDAYNLVCTNGAASSLLGVNGTSIAKNSTDAPNDAANLWDVRLVDVKTYASAYMESVHPESMDGVIGHAPSKAVATTLQSGISACPDRASNPTPAQETTLADILNYYIDHKEDINKPTSGQYVTFVNRSASKYIGENLYEMKAADAVDLGCVWETIVEEDKYYFRNVKSGMYMGKVTQSAIGRLTVKNNGANKQEIDIIKAPNREQNEGFVALHEMGTNNYRSFIHYASNGRSDIVGWENAPEASHWTINAVSNENLISYLKAATQSVKTQLGNDLATYNTLTSNGTANIPGNYEKSSEVRTAANTAATLAWTETNDTAVAHNAYRDAVAAFNTFTTAGTQMENNEMFLIKTSIELNDQQGQNPAKYFVTQVMDDTGNHEEVEGGSVTNGVPQSAENEFYLFTLWQAVKDGDYYKLFNFYTGYYLSKDISLSDDNRNRYGLTTDPDEAASFIITPQHGCFVSFHRSDYDEMNNGYLFMQTNPSGARTMFGLTGGNIVTGESGRMLFELEPATTEHYEKCLATMLNYEIGDGIGRYTDVSGNYATERDKVSALITAQDKPVDYAEQLKTEAKAFAPILAGLRINLPEAGKYYRIYNITGDANYYITKTNPGSGTMAMNVMTEESAKNDPNSVFYYDGSYLLAYGNGYYVGGWAPWGQGNLVNGEHQKWAMSFANTGYMGKGKYSIKPVGRSYLYNNKNLGLNGWSASFNPLCEWTIEEVTELPLVVSAAGYSTIVSGRSHNIPEGVNCYVAETASIENSTTGEGTISLVRIKDGKLPANVPILVKAAAGTYLFTDASDAPSSEVYKDNLFSGKLETDLSGYTSGNHKQYTLQSINNKTGFYKYTGTYLAGFKCYLDIENVEHKTGAKFSSLLFSFSDEATGIADITRSKKTNTVYDIYGRKVKNPTHGIYIINGKKVFINK